MNFDKLEDGATIRSIAQLAEDTMGTETVGGLTYWKKTQALVSIPVCTEPLAVKSLKSVIEYCKGNTNKILVECGSKVVKVLGEMNIYKKRDFLVKAEFNGFNFSFGHWYTQEEFVIAVLSQFEPTEDRKTVLSYSSNVEDSNISTLTDDMVSQAISVRVSAANVEKVKVPNPVTLKPKRTFSEIEQEETQFIFRMKKIQDTIAFALFEADGGQWEEKVVAKIKKFISDAVNPVKEGEAKEEPVKVLVV